MGFSSSWIVSGCQTQRRIRCVWCRLFRLIAICISLGRRLLFFNGRQGQSRELHTQTLFACATSRVIRQFTVGPREGMLYKRVLYNCRREAHVSQFAFRTSQSALTVSSNIRYWHMHTRSPSSLTSLRLTSQIYCCILYMPAFSKHRARPWWSGSALPNPIGINASVKACILGSWQSAFDHTIPDTAIRRVRRRRQRLSMN